MEDKHKIAIELFSDVIQQTNGIDFIEFVDHRPEIKRLVLEGASVEQIIDTCDYPCKDIYSWITAILKRFAIQGDFLFSFNDRNRWSYTLPSWSKVQLSSDYEWVKPLWELGEDFAFVPIDRSYYLQILWEDSKCICVIAYLKDLQVEV